MAGTHADGVGYLLIAPLALKLRMTDARNLLLGFSQVPNTNYQLPVFPLNAEC